MILTTKIAVTPEMALEAKSRFERMKHKRFDGSSEQVIRGLTGELALFDYLVGGMQVFRVLPYGDGGTDFEFKGRKLDVKTKSRGGWAQPDYDCSVEPKQFNGCPENTHFVFLNYNLPLDTVEVLGWLDKPDMKLLSRFYNPGDWMHRSDGSTFKMREGGYLVYVKQLKPIEELKYLE